MALTHFLVAVALAGAEGDETAGNPEADRAFKAANELFEKGKREEALRKYLECLSLAKDHRGALFNGGLVAYLTGKHKTAAELFERLRSLKPDDTGALGKLVQTYEAQGALEKRDDARRALFDVRAGLPEDERAELRMYCREQFLVGKTKVMAFEYFELEGDQAVRYRFAVVDEKDKEIYRISLGSYELTTKIAREQGVIGKKERMWHLDRYDDAGQSLVAMMKAEPTYEEARARVKEAIGGKTEGAGGKGKAKPAKETKPGGGTKSPAGKAKAK